MTMKFDFSGGSPEIAWQRSYWLNEQRIADSFGIELPPRLQDLLTVAMATYVADRRALRPLATLGLWGRKLALRVPVRDADFWSKSDVAQSLDSYISWLTEDQWEFEFVAQPARGAPSQGHIFASPVRRPAKVALFSGGLDSLAGSAIDLRAGHVSELILVAASSNDALRRVQFDLVRGLRLLGNVRHINVPLKLVHRIAGRKDERTQRSRGFVYAAIGSVVAELAGAGSLTTYENGVGGLNLPYVESQVGAQASRSVHPKTLRQASRLISLVLDRPFTFEAPNFGLTKTELCARVPNEAHALVGVTVSCDGFPSRIAGRLACGACTSCLLRRQALYASGLARLEARGAYRADDPRNTSHRLAEKNLHSMLGQARAITSLCGGVHPWNAMIRRFPALAAIDEAEHQPLFSDVARRQTLDLLTRYAREWHSYPSPIVRLYFPDTHYGRAANG